jgi:uncharacterized membrane protein YidH (DUF202 family)
VGALALVLLLVTGLGGTVAVVDWYESERQRAPRGTTAVVAGHVTLAVATLVVMAAFLLGKSGALGWAMIAALVATGALGATAFLRSRRGRSAAGGEDDRVAPAVLVFHGAAAALTLLFAVLAALAVR